MAIPMSGTFDYRFRIRKGGSSQPQSWLGRGVNLRAGSGPSLCGSGPELGLSVGWVTLHSNAVDLNQLAKREFGNPVESASFQVGDSLALALRDQDTLLFSRYGTGDLAIGLVRDEKLVLGLGAVTQLHLGPAIHLEDDPRLKKFLGEYPKDLYVTVARQGTRIRLHEGEEGLIDGLYARLQRSYRREIPGQLSIMAVADLKGGITKETVVSSLSPFLLGGNFRMSRYDPTL